MKNQKLSKQVQESMDFLNNHPGVCYDGSFTSNMLWWMVDRCKHGQYKDHYQKPKNVEVRLYKKDKDFNKFWEKYKDIDDNLSDDYVDIYVPYKEIYGEIWKYNKTEYNGEYCFYKYSRNENYIKYLKTSRKIDDKEAEEVATYMNNCWNGYQGGMVHADSFEKMIINIADDVKIKYGDFCNEDFLTSEEKQNHKDQWLIKFKKLDDGSGHSEMLTNDKYMKIGQPEYNRRWWKWFIETEFYKTHWK